MFFAASYQEFQTLDKKLIMVSREAVPIRRSAKFPVPMDGTQSRKIPIVKVLKVPFYDNWENNGSLRPPDARVHGR